MDKKMAVVLVSGGLDSALTAAIAAEKYELAFLHVNYGQRTESRELKAFKDIARYYGVKRKLIVDISYLKEIGGSSLTDERIEVGRVGGIWENGVKRDFRDVKGILLPTGSRYIGTGRDQNDRRGIDTLKGSFGRKLPQDDIEYENGSTLKGSFPDGSGQAGRKLPQDDRVLGGLGGRDDRGLRDDGVPMTYVPFRNANILAIGVSWAEVIGAKRIYIGAVEEDSSGYPDCRKVFFEAYNEMIKYGTKPGSGIKIVTPLIKLSKKQIVQKSVKLGSPIHLTWSCYSESRYACGECESCALRLRGFRLAGVKDPIKYFKGMKA